MVHVKRSEGDEEICGETREIEKEWLTDVVCTVDSGGVGYEVSMSRSLLDEHFPFVEG